MAKKRIMVLYGGRADEHSISCVSTAGVLNAWNNDKFEAVPVGITKDGHWVYGGTDPRSFKLDGAHMPTVEITPESRPVVLNIGQGRDGFLVGEHEGFFTPGASQNLDSLGHIDAVFPVLHGPYGEDGTVQGLLEMMGVPYVGCGVFASAGCMDKHYTKILLQAAGIPVVPGITLDTRRYDQTSGFAADADALVKAVRDGGLEYPVFVKPSRAGSSFGVTKVDDEDPAALAAAVFEASHHDWRVLIETGITAREIECAVFAPRPGDEPRTSWPGEIVLDHVNEEDQFYDFDSKYTDATASHVEVPAKLPQDALQKVRDVAARAFTAVDGAGLSRVDTFVKPDGEVMVNEINTMPGFTPISMYPKAWEASGMSYAELIEALIEGILD